MGQPPRALVVLLGIVVHTVLGLSGCLLFTDPINEAPVVTIDPHPQPVYRGIPTSFTVHLRDEDSLSTLRVRWHEFPADAQGCDYITKASWAALSPPRPEPLSSDAPFQFTARSLGVSCLCAQTVDHHGATGQDCARIAPLNPIPLAKITTLSGGSVAGTQAKCSRVGLAAEDPMVPAADGVEYEWTLEYAGSDPAGKAIQLAPCEGISPPRPGAYQCFPATVAGDYTVRLTVKDTPPEGVSNQTKSEAATTHITVLGDTPACIEQTSPPSDALWILLPRSSALAAGYQPRTLVVSSVRDDCEPFPGRVVAGKLQSSLFVWSVMDKTQGKTTWEVQANPTNSNSFTINPENFPNARPADTIRVRVEVRDTPTQLSYPTAGAPCEASSVDICCGSSRCMGVSSDCIRWTTWTVQFQP